MDYRYNDSCSCRCGIISRRKAPGEGQLDPDMLKGLVRGILSTRDEEIDCDQCLQELDRFVELTLAGKREVGSYPRAQAPGARDALHPDPCSGGQRRLL